GGEPAPPLFQIYFRDTLSILHYTKFLTVPVHQWWMDEEKKRKEQQRKNDLVLINRQLQRLVKNVEQNIERTHYEEVTRQLENRYQVVQSSLWNLSWANNFESERVAVAQGLLIAHILKHEDFEGKGHVENKTKALMRRLSNVDWGAYQEFIRRKHFL
ncbi:hypothetical protein, partial [Caldibacillus debilis]